MSTASTPPPIVRFYDPQIKATDAQGRTLADILSWSDDDLEFSHDYIQTIFPLPERSPIDPDAPVIDRATFDAFRSRLELRTSLYRSLKRMCKFYGFEVREKGGMIKIVRAGGGVCYRRAANWVKTTNHNHLRITRIIRCLRVLGLEHEAKAFFIAVKDVHQKSGRIGGNSLEFWTRAMARPLCLAPEDRFDEGKGKDFLYEFEARWWRKDEGKSWQEDIGGNASFSNGPSLLDADSKVKVTESDETKAVNRMPEDSVSRPQQLTKYAYERNIEGAEAFYRRHPFLLGDKAPSLMKENDQDKKSDHEYYTDEYSEDEDGEDEDDEDD